MCCLYSLSSFQPNKLWRILNFLVHEDLLTLVLPLVDPQLKHFLWITETLDIHTAFQFQRQGKYLDSGLIKISYLVFKQIYTLSSWSPTGPFIGILYQFESNNDRVALLQLFCVVVQVVIMSLGEFPEQGRCKLFTSKVWGWVFFGACSQYTNCAEQGAKGYIGLHQKYHCWPISGTMARDNCNRGRSHQPSPHSHSVERSSNSMRMRRTWRARSMVFR